jgi:hypothetical protein
MSLPRPIHPYHFQADLIWSDGPFKALYIGLLTYYRGRGGATRHMPETNKKESTKTSRKQSHDG